MEYYKKVLNHYADFTGRARRKEYWMFVLVNFLVMMVVGIISGLLSTAFSSEVPFVLFYGAYSLAILVPTLAVTVRRLHDIGKSGWMYFVGLIPLIGGIWLLVLLVTEGNHGPNQYGEDPKNAEKVF
ncbi:DUF805 domain-containing protein [Echinicola vietnamensis]|uniref:Putative membrane protein n=1 Tax=Echinicola vietnamensis (strain DSM 17526 / LMG 23754 / KMM 6221) TaxID=926556 RepID=L0FVA7_ECHVK|nr:DUF805 domain-containing protein [Echinicola vietnamensis]AGA77242.1 putative membrane protein [Echinicola vietnamensis DSM 17526]